MDDSASAIGEAALVRGRDAAERSAWAEVYEWLSQADGSATMRPTDLEMFATAAYLLGHTRDSLGALQRAYKLHIEGGDVQAAVRCAFWLCFQLISNGEFGQAEGWLARVSRVVDEHAEEGAAQGYLLLPQAFQQAVIIGDFAGARETAARAADFGRRFGEPDLVALALNIAGRASLAEGRVREGLAALDEAMVAVLAGELTAPAAGTVYCSVIDACEEISELGRAHEWTAALSDWCDRQQGLVTFTGQCLVHRATIRQLRGEWEEAIEEALVACERLANAADRSATGAAMYRLGELHRCRGDDDAAADAYREASQWGYDPQPGLALLWLAEGRIDPAVAAVSRAVDEAREPTRRAKLLPAYVAVLLTAGDVSAARRAADELTEIAATYGTAALLAEGSVARGTVLVADGDCGAALLAIREAVKLWRDLNAPYEEARARMAVALACRAAGDEDSATLELEAARGVFRRLGAGPALAEVDSLLRPADTSHAGLSPRELEVLRLLATGKTNRMIADELMLAVRTVDRHVSNILTKLGVASRSAATAYAYEHRLV
jgi:DNA-binding CsgD family transcriptional regulator/tetratricopeptide (TPR) repeat protein